MKTRLPADPTLAELEAYLAEAERILAAMR